MARQFHEYTEQFFWSFKMMDNVNYNFQIIEALYLAKKQNGNNMLFNKPITILIMAIIECMLYDFIVRIHTYSNDPFPNITQSIVSYLRGINQTDQLKIIIPRIKSQNLLRASAGDSIYDDLEHLRNVRNRLHIQNKYNMLHKDEHRVFTQDNLKTAEQCLEKVCNVLCNVYPRWKRSPMSMNEFPRPWIDS